MTAPQADPKQILTYQTDLLSFESQQDRMRLSEAIRDRIRPRDILEEMWTSELVEGEWETLRYRRIKGEFVKLAKSTALRNILKSTDSDADDGEIDNLASRWFTNQATRKRIGAILRSFGLDESAIDAEALRLSIGDLALINRRLAELAARRDKILRQIEDYRAGLSVLPGAGPGQ